MIAVRPLRADDPAGASISREVKIGFVLLSNSRQPEPSTRIATLNMFPFLKQAGFDPHIVFEPKQGTLIPELPELADSLSAAGFRVVVFQKLHGASVEMQVRRLRERGILTVYSVCDHVVSSMTEATDATIVVTDYLRGLYPTHLQSRIHVVHDGIEHPEVHKIHWSRSHGSRREPLTSALVTSYGLTQLPAIGRLPDWLSVTIVGRYAPARQRLRRLRETRWALARQSLREKRQYLGFLLDRQIARVAWHPSDVYKYLVAADIGIIPIDPGIESGTNAAAAMWRVKSENRLTLKMAVGLPVVATPIPAYEEVIDHGVNGFLARTHRDWQQCLTALRDPDLRRAMGERARATVLERYGQEEQARRLVGVLRGVLA